MKAAGNREIPCRTFLSAAGGIYSELFRTQRNGVRESVVFLQTAVYNKGRAARFADFARKFFCSFFRRKSQRRPRGENYRESAAHLAERSRKTALIARSFRALGVRRLLRPTFSHRGGGQVCDLPKEYGCTIPQIR